MKRIPITKLQEVNEIFEQIRDLEAEKQDMADLAKYVSEHPGNIQLVLATDQVTKKKDKLGSEGLTHHLIFPPSIMEQFGMRPHLAAVVQRQPEGNRGPEIVDLDIPEAVTLQVIALLTGHKNAQIKALVDKLVEMGFER